MGVVAALEVAEELPPGVAAVAEGGAVDEFAFEAGEKLSAMALSKQSPALPMEGSTLASRQRVLKAREAYWLPRSEW